MIVLNHKVDCCGCGACYDACARNAIEWTTDEEGFSYPKVDTLRCVDCGFCEMVCPVLNANTINDSPTISPVIYGAYHKDDNIRLSSTSGGAFWGLAEPWIMNGGYVAGAIFLNDFSVKHFLTNNIDGLNKIKGSKYTQSDCRGIYKEIASLLRKGEKVMATGTPCQMAGLKQYLRKDYDNLILVNLFCHSVTSPMAFDKYLRYLEKKYKSRIINYHPKNKEYGGWHHFAFKAEFENGKQYVAHAKDDYYTQLFVGSTHLLTRPSCFECRFKEFPQPTDITIGDLWGVDKFDPSFDSPKGLSIVIANTEKGKKYIETIDSLEKREYSIETAILSHKRNIYVRKSVPKPDSDIRKAFVNDLNKMDFEACMKKYIMPTKTIKDKILEIIKRFK